MKLLKVISTSVAAYQTSVYLRNNNFVSHCLERGLTENNPMEKRKIILTTEKRWKITNTFEEKETNYLRLGGDLRLGGVHLLGDGVLRRL